MEHRHARGNRMKHYSTSLLNDEGPITNSPDVPASASETKEGNDQIEQGNDYHHREHSKEDDQLQMQHKSSSNAQVESKAEEPQRSQNPEEDLERQEMAARGRAQVGKEIQEALEKQFGGGRHRYYSEELENMKKRNPAWTSRGEQTTLGPSEPSATARSQAGAEIGGPTHGTDVSKQTSSVVKAENAGSRDVANSGPSTARAGPENGHFVHSALQRMLLERYGKIEAGRTGSEMKQASSTVNSPRDQPGVQAQASNTYAGALQRDTTNGAWVSSLEDYPRAIVNVPTVGNHNARLGTQRSNVLRVNTPRQGELHFSGDVIVDDSPKVANQPVAIFTATSPVVPTPDSTASPEIADPGPAHIAQAYAREQLREPTVGAQRSTPFASPSRISNTSTLGSASAVRAVPAGRFLQIPAAGPRRTTRGSGARAHAPPAPTRLAPLVAQGTPLVLEVPAFRQVTMFPAPPFQPLPAVSMPMLLYATVSRFGLATPYSTGGPDAHRRHHNATFASHRSQHTDVVNGLVVRGRNMPQLVGAMTPQEGDIFYVAYPWIHEHIDFF
ncbi:hypothetical protein DL769_007536 [Monosporascus sp. CRB-8-3]|nr:hypothetical protein DL769_007536 [Monosporascus sp. CRB-8-3]